MTLALRLCGGVLLLLDLISCGAAGCENTVLSDSQSPNGRYHVVVFARSCGATTDFSTQVSIEARSKAVLGAGNVLIADTDHGKAPPSAGGGPEVTAHWLDSSTVEISYDARARVFHKATRQGQISIHFETTPASTMHT